MPNTIPLLINRRIMQPKVGAQIYHMHRAAQKPPGHRHGRRMRYGQKRQIQRALIRQLALYPEEIKLAARDYDPSRVNRYVTALAGEFHRFYNACRIKGEQPALTHARLKLADTVRMVIENALSMLGVTAPEHM
jgi:arginyl-tRNA synthetase